MSSSSPSSTSPQDASLSPLPQNWEKYQAQDGKEYYANRVTGESLWEKPQVQKLPPPPLPPPPQPPLLQQQKHSAFSNAPVKPAKKQRQGTISSLLQIKIKSKAEYSMRLKSWLQRIMNNMGILSWLKRRMNSIQILVVNKIRFYYTLTLAGY